MWLNDEQVSDLAINGYRKSLLTACPNHIVIDNLFDDTKLDEVLGILQQAQYWEAQKHTYSALYVGSDQWQEASGDERFVQRDVWQGETVRSAAIDAFIARDFLSFLRGDEFMSLLSRIFKVSLTDMNVAEPEKNTNFFRLGINDFVKQHADDSPGREVCMLLYLNKAWSSDKGGDLVFIGRENKPVSIAPLYNRCVFFDPSSKGSEHWVELLTSRFADEYRYNVTSWYWSE